MPQPLAVFKISSQFAFVIWMAAKNSRVIVVELKISFSSTSRRMKGSVDCVETDKRSHTVNLRI